MLFETADLGIGEVDDDVTLLASLFLSDFNMFKASEPFQCCSTLTLKQLSSNPISNGPTNP